MHWEGSRAVSIGFPPFRQRKSVRNEMLDFYDPARQQLLGDDAGVNGGKAANYLKVLAADVKGVHPGVLVGRHNTINDNFPARE